MPLPEVTDVSVENEPAQEDDVPCLLACLIAVVSISWDTLDALAAAAIVVGNLVMQRIMPTLRPSLRTLVPKDDVAVIRPRARRTCLGPYVMRARHYLIRKKRRREREARIRFVLGSNNFGAIRRGVLSRSAW